LFGSRRALFDVGKYKYARQILTYYDQVKNNKNSTALIKLIAKYEYPNLEKTLKSSCVVFPLYPFVKINMLKKEKLVKQDVINTLKAVDEYLSDYSFLKNVLTESGYLLAVDGLLNGNSAILRMLLWAVENYIMLNDTNVTLKNLIIDMKEVPLSFTANENVKFENCEFIGENCPITFTSCKKVGIEKCVFRDFKTKTIIEDEIGEVTIVDCKFVNCQEHYYYYGFWHSYACVIFTDNIYRNGTNNIIGTEFKECGGRNSANVGYASEFISNCRCQISRSKFYNCWHYYNKNEKDIDVFGKRRRMFDHNITTFGDDNEVIGSADL